MEELDKLPLKRVEVSLTKFNDVAIPHHLDLLRQHKANIIKYEECGRYARARGEQASAARVAAQLRALLLELDALRRRVRDDDRARFDALTQRSRDTTLRAIVDYLGTSPLAVNRVPPEGGAGAGAGAGAGGASAASTDSVGLVAHAGAAEDPDADGDTLAGAVAREPQIQLRVDEQEVALHEREALLRGWSELQAELRALHDVWQHAQAAALAQRDQVAAAASSVEVAADNVGAARSSLAAAERLRAGALGAGGAALGALVGGPVGLAVGAKAGAAAALAGSLLGFLGARLLGRRRGAGSDAAAADDDGAALAAVRDRKND